MKKGKLIVPPGKSKLDAEAKNWPGASGHRVDKLEKAHKQLEKQLAAEAKRLDAESALRYRVLKKEADELKAEVDELKKQQEDHGVKGVITALNKGFAEVAEAIREGGGGGPITQEGLDAIAVQAKGLANRVKGIADSIPG
jgi:hypothetical protein